MVSLWAAVEAYDAEAADQALARLLWDMPLSRSVTEFLLPFLHEVGERWESGDLAVAHEHFFTSLVMRRLSAFAPVSVPDDSPVVVLACPPGERHEIVLLCFGLLLGEYGVRVRFLGADTPITAMSGAVRTAGADALVIASTRPTALSAHATHLIRLAERHPVYVGGRGADEEVARVVGAALLPSDPVKAAEVLVDDLTGERQ